MLRPLATALPRSAAAQYALARAYELAGNRVLRRARLRATVAADPGHERASLEFGRLLLADGDEAGVAALVTRLREAAPDHPFVSEVDGYDALRQGRHVDAVSLLARAADQAPWSNLAVALADAQHAAGLAQASIETLEAWLAEAPNDDPVRFVLSNHYIGQQRHEDALAALLTLEARAPDNVFVLNNIAWLRMTLGDATGAASYAERALAVDGRDPKVLDTAASIQLALGRADRAAALWQRALAIEPDSGVYRENLSRAVAAVSSGAE